MKELEFTVDSALLSELGEKLVETVHVALAELVKNAYDADATQVTVKITPLSEGAPTIEVADNGTGMTLSEVKKLWMRIATTNKVTNDRSALFGRPRTGSKGIGRFSCRRLGRRLELTTESKRDDGRFERTEVIFNWDEFEAGTEVTDIKCSGTHRFSKTGSVGTKLVISGGDTDEWQMRGFNWLQRQLAILVANRGAKRRGFEEDPGFSVVIDAPGLKRELIDLREDLINGGWGTLEGKVDRQGNATYKLEAKGLGRKRISFPERCRDLAGVSFRIGIISDKKPHHRNPSLLANYTLREILPKWGGIVIRQSGFRVYPYGDLDWLGIDHDRGLRRGTPGELLSGFASKLKGIDPRRALLGLLSFRSHVGDVELGESAVGFEPKASREGFKASPSFDALVRIVRYGIDWATIYRNQTIRQSRKEQIAEMRDRLQTLLGEQVAPGQVVGAAVRYIRKEAEHIIRDLPADVGKPINKTISAATKAILQHEEERSSELHQLRLIASTSSLVLIFAHEVRQLLGLISSNVSTLKNIRRKLHSTDRKQIDELQSELDYTRRRFSDLLDMTSLVGIDGRSSSPKRIAAKSCLERSISCFKLIVEKQGIDIDISGVPNRTIVGPIIEAELYAIFLNVISNAIKSVVAANASRQIRIAATKNELGTVFHICDTGVGLKSNHYEEVFRPFVADIDGTLYRGLDKHLDSKDQEFVGAGSGLGLSIVRQIVESRDGAICFREPTDNWSADLEITLP